MAIKTKPVRKPHKDAVEIRERRRSIHSKTFQLPDGKFTCNASTSNIEHYISDENELRTCDTTVQEDSGRVFVEWLPYKFELMPDKIGFKFEMRTGGKIETYLKNIGISFTRPIPIIEENKITFPEVVKDLDIVFIIYPQRVKTLRIVKSATAPRVFEWDCKIDSGHEDKIDTDLFGTDASGKELELSCVKSNNSYIETWTGKVKVRDLVTRIKSLSEDVTYPVEIDPTVNTSISATANDGHEYYNWYSNSTVIKQNSFGRQHAGCRMLLNIPQGATISSATFAFKVSYATTLGVSPTIFGRASDNCPSFGNGADLPSAVSKTSASCVAGQINTSGTKSLDVTSIVQEIVNRPGFVQNNYIGFAIISPNAAYGKVIIVDYQQDPSNKMSLSVTYTTASGSCLTFNRRNPGGFKKLGL